MRSLVAAAVLSAAVLPLPQPVHAQVETRPAAVPTPLETRAATLPALLREGADVMTAFTPAFLAAVPPAQINQIFASLRLANGAPMRVERLGRAASPGSGTVVVAYERALVTFDITVDGGGLIAGLRITDVATAGDTMEQLVAEIAALPGDASWGIYRLGSDGRPNLSHGRRMAEHRAIGSSFKLAILGALDAEVAARRMRWSDVVRLDRQSVPSSAILGWPQGAPMTLHSLATLMISVSDNRATDILLHHLGRERVERFARTHGGLSGPNAYPLLSTLEGAVLKNPAIGAARNDWLAGTEAGRRAILARHASTWSPADVDYAIFAAGPADIETIEWFASPDSIAQLLGWFASSASDDARAILAVNSGLPPSATAGWDYVGFKGGSEPGVVALNYLLRAPDGTAYAVAMAWNNARAPVDESRFAALAARAVALMRPVAEPATPRPAP